MEKFSVKKPFTVLVAVIMVIMLGLVSVQNMQTNLLPNVNTPYLMVVTVYPGASPERVENEVSDVMESALGTISGVKNVTATSAENYSLLLMEFEDDTDMNSAVVKVSNKVDQTTSSLPSTCMTPSIIEYTLNMNAFMTVAVSREGSDSYELADFVNDTMVPYIERQGGVSNISANGLVTRMVQVQLDQEKIDAINEKLLEVIDVQLADAKAQLDTAEAQIEDGRKQYETQLANYDKLVSDTINSQYSGELQDSFMLVKKQAQALLDSVNQLIAVVNEPEIQQALIDVRDGLQRVVDKFNETGMQDIDSLIEIVAELRDITDKLTNALQELQQRLNAQGDTAGTTAGELADDLQVQQSLNNIYSTLESTIKAMDDVPGLMDQFTQIVGSYSQQQLQAYIKFTEAREMLNDYEKQLEDAKQQYEDAKQMAMENSDVAKMLDIDTLAQLIYAQNFSMPAGYVKDSSNKSWLLKVGEEYDSIEDISGALLLHVDGFGDVRLSDVADVQIIDNAEDSFTRLNGERSVVLKIFKSNSSSAGEVSGNCKAAFKELEQKFDMAGLSKSPSIFDIKKLTWMNSEYLKAMDFDKYFELARPKLEEALAGTDLDLKKIAALLQKRLETLNDIPCLVDFFKELPDYSTELYTHKKMKTNDEIALSSLQAALPVLENLSDWNETAIHDSLMALVGELGIKNGQLLWPVRTALSGEQTSPGGAMELADILGKEEALRRIRKGIEKLSK